MYTQTVGEQVRWQDLKVRSEIDIVLEIAKKEGWKDCEVFGYGDMITQPQESMGWKLVPADIYKYSIPTEAVRRLHHVINAGVRVQGVIIADDKRRTEVQAAPAKHKVSLAAVRAGVSLIGKALSGFIRSVRACVSWTGRALLGSFRSVGAGVSWLGKALLGLIRVAGMIALVSFLAVALIHFWPVLVLGLLVIAGSSLSFDPKLIILVDDGRGGTTWVSLLTWYD